jgi:hypothetical protein
VALGDPSATAAYTEEAVTEDELDAQMVTLQQALQEWRAKSARPMQWVVFRPTYAHETAEYLKVDEEKLKQAIFQYLTKAP